TVLLTNQYKPNPSLAGDIEVSATLGSLVPNVAIQNGQVSKGGSVTIDSRGSITLNGIVNTIAIPSNDPSNPFSGNGGDVTFLADNNITLNPGSLIVSAGIVGGKITLESGSNFLLDDAGVFSATTGAGVGGNLIVNASESVTLINREGLAFSNFVKLLNELSNSDNEFTNSEPLQLILQEVLNGFGLATITTGPGDAGNLTITGKTINIETLSIQNQAQNQELRSLAGATTAITRDITRNTGATTATTRDSSDNSGNLTVYPESGEIVGNETGPFIPTPIDVSRLIEKNLCAAGEGTEFTATGSGGLPISPKETLNPIATWDDSRITEQPQTRIRKDRSRSTQDQQPQTRITKRRLRSRQHQIQINQPQTKNPKPKQIVEAQGWVMGANGEVILTAHPVIVTPKGTWLHQVDCQRLQETLKRLR
ncbi:hypothetical protein, partial [Moorena sp. SIO3E8]